RSPKGHKNSVSRMSDTPPQETDAHTAAPSEEAGALARVSLLLPYLRPDQGMVWGAVLALVCAAGAPLVIGPALRMLVDHGFDATGGADIDHYFLALGGVVVVLGVATVFRYYLVSTLGEMVVADLRRDVFFNLVTLTPEFFESNRPSEIASRLT